MKKKFNTIGIGKKVIPTAAALGILFSVAPIAENKASAGIGTVLDVTITSLGIVKDIYEGLGISPKDPGPGTHIDVYAENITYRAPNFTSGEFNISMHHTEDDSNFTKSVKVLYPNGKIEIHKLRSGQQLKITEAGTIIDLNPDAKSVSEHDLLYITQAQLDEGKTGVVMNQGQTAFVEKTSGKNPRLVIPFHKKRYPSYTSEWSFARGTDALFAELSDEEKRISTLTSKPVSKDVLENYVKNDPKARADFNNRSTNILAESTKILETPITLPFSILNDGKPYQIIPYKKGTNKVLVKTGSKYLSGKEGNALQYSDSIGDDEVFELVQTGNSHDNKFQFYLKNKNGVSLAGNSYVQQFGTDWSFKSEIRFTAKTNNEIHNWLREWYPGKENEKQNYDGIEFRSNDKGDSSIWTAYDSTGKLIKNSWVNQGTQNPGWYYADASGVLLKGWQKIEGNTYYFNPESNMMASGINSQIEGKYYHFNDSGALQRSAWRDNYYSDASGALVKEGLREIDGKIYDFQNYQPTKNKLRLEDQKVILHFSDKGVLERASDLNGNALTTPTTVIFNEKQLAFEKNGAIRKSGVTEKRAFPQPDGSEKDAIHYYSLEEGATYAGWKTIDGKKYHFKDGAHYTFDGHETIDGKRYYFNHDGEAKLTGFDKVDGKIYHYDDKGVMQTGWQEIDGKWYYFDDSGAAKIGWFSVGGGYHFPYYGYFTYYAKQDGSIYTDTKVEINGKTYKFDSHGHKGY
ncbi:cell wall-binding protein [Bacillus pseudomycoides]|uniref:N-acetylmuramoyl-L-alanine amidase family protein n=1 Tax=Bacillus pseudomycoides TaxID=64104 RepID=UPI000BEC1E84|nr:cell wall-binding protein [Bacillus pseudomycoides]PDY00024.1 cell wall-binding protein [Bacillus pseudomycoides]PEK73312.1 cell wall-binding protein [Bacillus pseudomycoides]PEN04057.1 cell wall-binding protein [Bacillus pseudomycoides]PGB84216.1 cell wall-binding protein [Bacillus pseudomycoides]